MRITSLPRLAASVLGTLCLTGCFYSVTYTNGGYHREGVFLPGPPPGPAPPNYAEPPTQGLELTWRPESGVYEVAGYPGHYYRLRHFFRCSEGLWQTSSSIEGPWSRIDETAEAGGAPLPEGLAAQGCEPAPEPDASSRS